MANNWVIKSSEEEAIALWVLDFCEAGSKENQAKKDGKKEKHFDREQKKLDPFNLSTMVPIAQEEHMGYGTSFCCAQHGHSCCIGALVFSLVRQSHHAIDSVLFRGDQGLSPLALVPKLICPLGYFRE